MAFLTNMSQKIKEKILQVYTRLEEDGLSDEQKSKSRIESMIGELSDLQQLPNRYIFGNL